MNMKYSSKLLTLLTKIKKKVSYIKWQSDFTFSTYTALHKSTSDVIVLRRNVRLSSDNAKEDSKTDISESHDNRSKSVLTSDRDLTLSTISQKAE
jgi:hypothetical protein